MLDQFVGTCDLIQWQNLCNVESLPTRLKSFIDVVSRFDLCLGWHIVTAHEEESGVHEDKLPDWSLWQWDIGGISRDRTALCQHLRIGLDVSSKSDLYDVMNALWSYRPDSFYQLVASKQDLVGSRTGCDLLVSFGTARGDHSCSRLVRELNGTSADRARSTLHKNGVPIH
jgi:hypothetical protein